METNQKLSNKNNLRKFIIQWNTKFPIDYLWRKKYGVAFGSQEHRHMSFIDMVFDFEEEILMNNIYEQNRKSKEENIAEIIGITDDEFDNIDLEEFNK